MQHAWFWKLFLRPTTLWVLFALTLINAGSFFLFAPLAGGWPLLDGLAEKSAIISKLGSLSADQRRWHLFITIGLDMIFPVLYGLLFIGVPMAVASNRPIWILCTPLLALVIIDLTENLIQVLLLYDHISLIDLKFWLTSVKRVLFVYGLLLTFSCSLVLALRSVKKAR